jgi:hypothetical protein
MPEKVKEHKGLTLSKALEEGRLGALPLMKFGHDQGQENDDVSPLLNGIILRDRD